MATYVLGADVSHWNIAWVRRYLQTLWDQGYRFLYIKVTENTNFEDPDWREIRQIAVDLGFKVGPYHYFIPGVNGTAQGGYFYAHARGVEWHLPPMLDVEEPGHYPWTGSKAVYAARVKACLFEIDSLFGKRALVYTSKSKWDTYVDTYVEEELFVAHWTTRLQPLIPRKWEGRGWRMWQHVIDGIDRDRFNGDEVAFAKWLGEDIPASDLERRVAALEESVQEIAEWIRSYNGDT